MKKTNYLEKRIGVQLRNNSLKSGSGTARNGNFAKAQAHEAGSWETHSVQKQLPYPKPYHTRREIALRASTSVGDREGGSRKDCMDIIH
jgi:hypothetical protein